MVIKNSWSSVFFFCCEQLLRNIHSWSDQSLKIGLHLLERGETFIYQIRKARIEWDINNQKQMQGIKTCKWYRDKLEKFSSTEQMLKVWGRYIEKIFIITKKGLAMTRAYIRERWREKDSRGVKGCVSTSIPSISISLPVKRKNVMNNGHISN